MKKHRILLAIAMCLSLCVLLLGCSDLAETPSGTSSYEDMGFDLPIKITPTQSVPKDDGLVRNVTSDGLATVYLPPEVRMLTEDSYAEMGWSFAAQNEEVLVLGARETKTMFESNDMQFPEDLEAYVDFLNENNPFPSPICLQDNGLYATSYVGSVNGSRMYIYVFTAAGEDAYWMMHFACTADLQDEYEILFPQWAQCAVLR